MESKRKRKLKENVGIRQAQGRRKELLSSYKEKVTVEPTAESEFISSTNSDDSSENEFQSNDHSSLQSNQQCLSLPEANRATMSDEANKDTMTMSNDDSNEVDSISFSNESEEDSFPSLLH